MTNEEKMTPEEAIAEISFLKVAVNNVMEQALEMAIQALSQEPCRVKNELNVELNELKPCTDAVSREAVLGAICDYVAFEEYEDKSHTFTVRPLEKRIKQLPSVTQKSGKWINDKNNIPICSRCGYIPQYDRAIDDYEYSNYCPSCGAKMESEVRNEV